MSFVEPRGGSRRQPFVASVEKCFLVLKAFRKGQRDLHLNSLSLSEVTRLSGLDKSAAQRFSETLVTLGYLDKHPETRRYRPAIKLIDFYYTFMVSNHLAQVAMPHLIEASKVYNTSVNLCELSDADVIFTVRIPQEKSSYGASLAGRRVPAFCGAPGTVLLAHMDDAAADEIYAASDIHSITEFTVTDIDELRQLRLAARKNGYHINNQGSQLRNISTAAPILTQDNRAVAAVHIPAYTPHWKLEAVEEKIVPLAIETANRISASLTEIL